MSKRCVEDSGLTPPKKIKAIQSPMRGVMFIVFAKRQFVCLTSTCAHGGGNNCKRHVESIRHKDYESLRKSQLSCLKFPEAK